MGREKSGKERERNWRERVRMRKQNDNLVRDRTQIGRRTDTDMWNGMKRRQK